MGIMRIEEEREKDKSSTKGREEEKDEMRELIWDKIR